MDGSYDPLQVNLPVFDGPLDLLLHLVRKQELDISEVRLADLTEPYLAYLERIQELNLDQGGEFLALASTLIWIKSRTLLPREVQDDEEELDPETLEEMLLLRLQAYQQFKDAAVQLADRDLLGRDVFPRSPAPDENARPEPEGPVFEEVSLYGLLEAFREALERAASLRDLHIIPERSRVEDKVDALLQHIAGRESLFLHELFDVALDREEIILTFIAVLELVRLKALRITQAEPGGPILCRPTEVMREGGTEFRDDLLENLFGTRPDATPSTEAPGADTAEAPTPNEPAAEG